MFSILIYMLLISTSIYFITLLFFLIGSFFPNKKCQHQQLKVSVIIAARNEEMNLPNILNDLTKQTYPKENFEVIIVDDHSKDRTYKIGTQFSGKYSYFRIIKAETDESGMLAAKKNAIQQGIIESRGEIILTTDADCRVRPGWIETMISYFNDDVGMVVGFSQMGEKGHKRSLFEQLQAIDFLALLSAAQGALNFGIPLAATGQNLAYRKMAFAEVGGFKQIGHRLSGDDVLLLQLIHTQTKWKIRFAPSPEAFNHTEPEQTLKGFLNQRKRWASNGSYQLKLNKIFFGIVVNTFLTNLLIMLGGLILIIMPQYLTAFLCCTSYKVMIEFLIIIRGAYIYERQDLIKYFPVWVLIQIPYVVFVGGLGNLTKFVWKGRMN